MFVLNRVLDKQIIETTFYVFTSIVGPEPLDVSYVSLAFSD